MTHCTEKPAFFDRIAFLNKNPRYSRDVWEVGGICPYYTSYHE